VEVVVEELPTGITVVGAIIRVV
jgi:hypothetical protein